MRLRSTCPPCLQRAWPRTTMQQGIDSRPVRHEPSRKFIDPESSQPFYFDAQGTRNGRSSAGEGCLRGELLMVLRPLAMLVMCALPLGACSVLLGDGSYAVGADVQGGQQDGTTGQDSGGGAESSMESDSSPGDGSSEDGTFSDSSSGSGSSSGTDSGLGSGSGSGADSGSGSGSSSGVDSGSGSGSSSGVDSGSSSGSSNDSGGPPDAGVDACGGTGGLQVLATNQNGPQYVAVTAAGVVWTNSNAGTVSVSSLDGCSLQVLASGQASPGGVVIQGTNVYFANNDNGTTNGSIVRVPIAGGAVTTLLAS